MYSYGRVAIAKALNRPGKYLQRWPEKPRVLIFGPPNVPAVMLSQRLGIDLGVPVINMESEFKKVQNKLNDNHDHPFFDKVRELLENQDLDAITREKIGAKLLRINEYAQEGFILNDFPNSIADAESLEELDGGMNAFVHLSMPDKFLAQIESSKYQCNDCDAIYWKDDVFDEDTGVSQASNFPEDGFCNDCGSVHIKPAIDPETFESKLQAYHEKKDELLEFYNYVGLLVDIDLRKGGLKDYERVKQTLQFNIKF
jgi:adenylate kinase family enzyme